MTGRPPYHPHASATSAQQEQPGFVSREEEFEYFSGTKEHGPQENENSFSRPPPTTGLSYGAMSLAPTQDLNGRQTSFASKEAFPAARRNSSNTTAPPFSRTSRIHSAPSPSYHFGTLEAELNQVNPHDSRFGTPFPRPLIATTASSPDPTGVTGLRRRPGFEHSLAFSSLLVISRNLPTWKY